MKHLHIRQERKDKDWTLDFVAEYVGISRSTVHDIETGKNKPSYDVLIKLCKLFQVPCDPIEQLFTAVDANNATKL